MLTVEKYNKDWPETFRYEKKKIFGMADDIIAIEHVGSTLVPNISAKPTIDICVGVKQLNGNHKNLIKNLQNIGYDYIEKFNTIIKDRRYLEKLDSEGNHLFHIHIVEYNEKRFIDYILFRDFLIAHPFKAKEYSELKEKLAAMHSDNRDQYSIAKSSFVDGILRLANSWDKKNNVRRRSCLDTLLSG